MTKPFEMLELLIRIQKVLERKGAFASEIRIKDVVIDPQKHTVTKNGEEVYLKPMEFEGETRTVDAASEHCRRKRLRRRGGDRQALTRWQRRCAHMWRHSRKPAKSRFSSSGAFRMR